MAPPGYSLDSASVLSNQFSNPSAEASTGASAATRPDAPQPSIDQTKQTIPGLGLGYFGTAAPIKNNARGNGKSTRVASKQAADESAEEGEIAEDDLEDLYDLQEALPVTGSAQPLMRPIETSYVDMSDEERQRSGSYSPFLSAGELEAAPVVPTQKPSHHLDTASVHQQAQPEPISVKDVVTAREGAKKAILRLQAAKIAYEDYITEGIDRSLLDRLFSELGLEKISKFCSPIAPTPPPTTMAPKKPVNHVTKSNDKKILQQPSDALDKSEERKDRIARLLAAKGSKATKSGVATVVGKVAKPPNAKVNSEKSKLLQKKMEALLKAREEKQHQLQRKSAAVEAITTAVPENASAHDSIPITDMNPVSQTQTATVNNDEIAKASINEAAVASISSPAAKPFLLTQNNSASAPPEEPFQRPFAKTQPLLIDVSDDDHDMDVEMELPDQRSSSLHAPTSPGRKQGLARRSLIQSPEYAAATPTGSQDLEKMNLRIEAMKRKIAEAELKKRLRPSAPASPVASPRPKAYDMYELKESSPDLSIIGGSSRLSKVMDARAFSPGSPKMNRSREASERLPMLESRRREKMLRLKALQSQVANIERELREGLEEEKKLREDLDYISDDDVVTPAASEPVAAPSISPDEQATGVEASRQAASHHQTEMLSSDHIATESSLHSSPEAVPEHAVAVVDATGSKPTFNLEMSREQNSSTAQVPATDLSGNQDTVMAEENGSGDEADDDSDGYEPVEECSFDIGVSPPNADMAAEKKCEATGSDPAVRALSAELLSTAGRQDSVPMAESEREVVVPAAALNGESPRLTGLDAVQETTNKGKEVTGGSSFLPYESPLRYFHSFRFHPDFSNVVAGGLRSATYSNKIDALQPLCPEETLGKACPRGANCFYQHFSEMNAPDDQILLQLGAHANCEESRKQEYIAGLRDLLTDYRNRKVKDFKTLSQGIIEYRARFQGDSSKVLPLGSISL